jgi:hypothetical protein
LDSDFPAITRVERSAESSGIDPYVKFASKLELVGDCLKKRLHDLLTARGKRAQGCDKFDLSVLKEIAHEL